MVSCSVSVVTGSDLNSYSDVLKFLMVVNRN